MDYINTNYVSFQDLEDIDSKITLLNEEKESVTHKIQAKTSNEQPNFANEISPQVLDLMKKISEIAPESSPVFIEELISANGDIAVLTRLLSLVRSRQGVIALCTALETGVAIQKHISHLSTLSSISEFEQIALDVKELAEEETIHDVLKSQLESAIEAKRSSIASLLSSTLSDVKWLSPKEKIVISTEKLKEISELFSDLIELQASDFVPRYPGVWWGLETLLAPFVMRFNYHFCNVTETNKLTKPEWALTYVEEFLKDSLPTLEFVVGDIFLKYEKLNVYEIISAVLVPVREKLRSMLSIINENILANLEDEKITDQYGRLLSHLIFEATSFDQRLRNTYKYNPHIVHLDDVPEKKWMGLAGDILAPKDSKEIENVSVNNWLKLELRLAKKRFETEIILPGNAFEIDHEFAASADSPESIVKPTYSAFGLAKLFDNLTTHFKTINIVKYQLKYVSQIQLLFLDQYLSQLHTQFRQFNESLGLKLISSFMKTSTKNDATSSTQEVVTNGLTGLQMLTGIYCLTKFVIEKMEEWAEDLIYIQLWNYCLKSSGTAGDSIFDSPISEYKSLLSKVTSKYEDFFRKEVRGALKEYVNASTWNIEDPGHKVQISSSLSALTTTLPTYASYLRRSLPEVDYFMISSKICDSYAQVMLEYVITNNQFTKLGLEQLHTDVEYLQSVLKAPLMLDHTHKYSNAENKQCKKLAQSIQVMCRFDASGARLLKKQFQNGDSVRSQFEDRLDCLSDSECLDLLFRII